MMHLCTYVITYAIHVLSVEMQAQQWRQNWMQSQNDYSNNAVRPVSFWYNIIHLLLKMGSQQMRYQDTNGTRTAWYFNTLNAWMF